MEQTIKTNEYDVAIGDVGKALAAIFIARRKVTVELSWEWARIAAYHASTAGVHDARALLGTSTWPSLHTLETAVMDKRSDSILIVTRHAGFVEWLDRRGLVGQVLERATPADVLGKNVIGNLPWQLAAVAASFTRLAIPNCPPERREDELTADDLEKYGAFLRTYQVREIQAIK